MKRLTSVLFIWFVLLAPLAAGNTHPALAASSSSPGAFDPGSRQSGEIAALRTRTSRTVAQDGHFVTTIYPYSINYQDASGSWQPINDSLTAATTAGFAYANTANRYSLHLPSSLSGPIHVGTGAGWVEFTLVGGSGTGAISGATDTFSLPSGNLSLTAGSDAVKESIVLNSAAAPAVYTYTLSTSSGLTARQNSQGGIDFVNSSGQAQFSFAPPYMYDNAGATSNSVTMRLGQGPNGQTVTVSADPAWLADPARSYPVTIDPTVTVSGNTSATNDCWIESGTAANTNECTNGIFKVGYDGSNDYRALLKFDLSAIPSNAQVLNAELGLRLYGRSTSAGIPLGVYPATHAWTTAATWNNYDGANTWATPGGDFSGSSAYTNTSVGGCLSTLCDWYYWYPTALVQNWVNGTTANDGIFLKEPTESTVNVLQMYSSKNVSSTWWPYLTVTYNPGIGEQEFTTFAAQQSLDDHMDIGVNPANGNLLVHESDLSMAGDGLPLQVDRYYNNLSATRADLGNGWRFSTAADTGLQLFNDGSADFTGPSGYQIPFIKNADGSFTAPTGIDSTLVKNGDGTYTMTDVFSGTTYTFSSAGQLMSEADTHNKLSFTYSGSWISAITDTQGKTTTFTRNSLSTAIVQMTDPAGRTYGYAYDTHLSLTGYTDPAGHVTSFAYDSNGNLTQITDPNGNQTRFTYDSSRRVLSIVRVTNASAGTGPTTLFTYNSGNTVVTDPDGNATTYAYDVDSRVTGITDPAGNTTQLGWTPDSHVTQLTDPAGHVTSNSYSTLNAIDRLTQTRSPLGATTTLQYGNSSQPYRPTAVTNAEGGTRTISYNPDGTVAAVVDPLQNSTSYAYNPDGTVASATPPDGNASSTPSAYTTKYSWTKGFLTGATPPSPRGSRSYSYNSYNLLSSSTNGLGQVTRYSYDPLGRVTGATYANGTTVGYATDPDGNVTGMTDPSGTYSYSYNNLNQLARMTYPSGNSYAYSYDPAGNLTSQQGPCGGTTPCPMQTYAYYTTGQLQSEKLIYQNCGCTNPPPAQTTTYQYNPTGEVTQVQLGNGLIEHYSYDADGNVTAVTVTNSSGQIVLSQNYSYVDPTTGLQTDQVTSYTDSEGWTHTETYDAAGQLIKDVATNTATGLTNTSIYTYDPNGNLLSETINGSVLAQMNYNTANELTGEGQGTTCANDPNGNQTGCSNGTAEAYDPAGNPTSVSVAGGPPTSLSYAGNDPSQPTNIGGNQTESSLAQLAYELLQNGSSETFQSLPDGTLVSMVDPSGQLYYVLQDPTTGGVIAMFDANGNVVDQCTYDALGKPSCSGSVSSPFGAGQSLTLPGGLQLQGGEIFDPASGQYLNSPSGSSPGWNLQENCLLEGNEGQNGEPEGCGSGASGEWYEPGAPEGDPVLGSKLDYLFGQATGSEHNIVQSISYAQALADIGIFDNTEGRAAVETSLETAYYENNILSVQPNGRIWRVSFLMGPWGGAKLESLWAGNYLITAVVKLAK